MSIVQGLERVNDHEELLTRVGFANLITVLKQRRDMVVLAADEAVPKIEPIHHATNLMAACEKVHGIFWGLKNRDIAWYTAS